MSIFDLSIAFADGKTVKAEYFDGLHDVKLEVRKIGELTLPTGQIVACDPFIAEGNEKPFVIKIKPDNYPVILTLTHKTLDHRKPNKKIPWMNETQEAAYRKYLAKFKTAQNVAFATLLFSNQKVMQWEIAYTVPKSKSRKNLKQTLGYSVDFGTGCFVDKSVVQMLADLVGNEERKKSLLDELEKNRVLSWGWFNYCLDASDGANLIAFSSGFGDGTYTSYLGYDSKGQIACLVTDFAVIDKTHQS